MSLLPKTKPAQLYTFAYKAPDGADNAAAAGGSAGAAMEKIGVVVPPPNFPRAGGGDQLLTVTGSARPPSSRRSRWVSPAAALFADAVERAFLSSPSTRLVRRQDVGAGAMTLRLDVDRFETGYAAPGASPTVSVTLKATLIQRGGDFGAERLFTASAPAADNRVGPIVDAYSQAVTTVVGDLRGWVEARAPAIVAAQDQAAASSRPRATPAAPVSAPTPARPQTRSTSTTTRSTQERPAAR